MEIYHYTKIEALTKIIESKKVRFTRIDTLDDVFDGNVPNEKEGNSNQFINSIFVACFTAISEEHYPLWKLYDSLNGVRFKIKSDLFGEINLEKNTTSITQTEELEYTLFGDDINSFSIDFLYGPNKINYVDEENDIIKIKKWENLNYQIQYNVIDLTFSKLKFYSFENEIRFAIAPDFKSISTDLKSHGVNKNVNKGKKYIDIPFYELIEEVVFGPMVDHCEEEVVSLKNKLKEYNPNVKIEKSKIVLRKSRR